MDYGLVEVGFEFQHFLVIERSIRGFLSVVRYDRTRSSVWLLEICWMREVLHKWNLLRSNTFETYFLRTTLRMLFASGAGTFLKALTSRVCWRKNALNEIDINRTEFIIPYAIYAWENTNSVSLEMLNIFHRLIIKTVMSKPRDYSTFKLHTKNEIFTIRQLFLLNAIKVINKFHKYRILL